MLKHIEIITRENKVLRGYLTMPKPFNGLIVLMYHGFTGNKTEHGGHFRDFARLLETNNIASLRMDFSGNGESDGDFMEFTFDTLTNEANLLLDYVLKIEGVKEVSLLGYSMGGAVAAMVASERSQEVDKLILWSPAGNILDIIRNVYEKSPKLENGNADYGNFELSKEMYESVLKYKMYDRLDRFNKKVLIVHGKKDLAVNPMYGEKYNNEFSDSKIHFIDTAGHGYDRREEKLELFNESLKYLKG